MRFTGFLITLLTLNSVLLQAVSACPVCYGVQDSPMTAGMNAAILVMLGITGFVLAIIVVFFLWMWRRNRRRREQISDDIYVNEKGQLQTKNEKGVIEWNNS
ncbi:MAG: hypothetical protein HY707_06185 [Ignavibacteriae bacterium]|nr:hypothetical protein [Ignavibacteriota bacterium]